jgi:hypothetical protein
MESAQTDVILRCSDSASRKEVLMKALPSGRIHGQVQEILNSDDSEWINVLSVTIAVLHNQFMQERDSKAAFDGLTHVPFPRLSPISKIAKRKAG